MVDHEFSDSVEKNKELLTRLVDCNDCAVRWSCSLEADGP